MYDYDWREDIIKCNECRYFNLVSDFISTHPELKRLGKCYCKNIDYTKHFPSKNPFDNHYSGEFFLPCKHFLPSSYKVRFCEQFTCIDDYIAYNITHGYINFHRKKVPFVYANDQNITYYVSYRDFYYGTYLYKDNTFKYLEKSYYKQSRKIPCGYELVKIKGTYDMEIKDPTFLDVLQKNFNGITYFELSDCFRFINREG